MNDINPYLPPRSEEGIVEEAREIIAASRGRRFGTLVIDYLGLMALSFCLSEVMFLLVGDGGVTLLEQGGTGYAFGLGVALLYYVVFEALWGRTPGKFIFGTVVVNEVGARPSLGQVFGRTFCRFIPFEVFSVLPGRGWHDSIPRTYVVMAR